MRTGSEAFTKAPTTAPGFAAWLLRALESLEAKTTEFLCEADKGERLGRRRRNFKRLVLSGKGVMLLISENDIVNAYVWLLGRVPSAGEIGDNRRHYGQPHAGDVHDLQRALLLSEEYRNRRLSNFSLWRSRPVELAHDRLVFMHIPKCGGTTLHAMLAALYAAERICPERSDRLGDWTINEMAAFDLFSGHFDLAACKAIPGTIRLVTLLREPKSRLLSLFRFWKSHRPHPQRDGLDLMLLARDLSAEEFFSHPTVIRHSSIRDAIAGQLLRTRNNRLLEDKDLIIADPRAALVMAWSALQSFSCFGIMERFEESRLLVNTTLGLHLQPVAPLQVLDHMVQSNPELVKVERVQVSKRLDQSLDDLTTIDRALYGCALTLFGRRVAQSCSRSTVGWTPGGGAADGARGGQHTVPPAQGRTLIKSLARLMRS